MELPRGEDPDSLVRRAGLDGWGRVRDAAYDALEFVHRHVLRTSTGGDPRERALQVVVRLLAGVTDPIRQRLLVERASQVFGLSESVIARASRLALRKEGATEPVSHAVRAQRRAEGTVERSLLQGLLHAPELLEQARTELTPEHFEDAAARALAELWWERGLVLPDGEGEAAALARELASAGGENLDQRAVVVGAIRRLKIRHLQRQRRARESELVRAREEELRTRLQREIQRIANELFELSK